MQGVPAHMGPRKRPFPFCRAQSRARSPRPAVGRRVGRPLGCRGRPQGVLAAEGPIVVFLVFALGTSSVRLYAYPPCLRVIFYICFGAFVLLQGYPS